MKFSHHTSGLARFSKAGLEDRTPARASFPLTGPIGHVFQLHVYHLKGFKKFKVPKKGLLHLGFEFPQSIPQGLLIRGEWRRKKDIIRNIHLPWGTAGPEADLFSRVTKSKAAGYFVPPPVDSPSRTTCSLSRVVLSGCRTAWTSPGWCSSGGGMSTSPGSERAMPMSEAVWPSCIRQDGAARIRGSDCARLDSRLTNELRLRRAERGSGEHRRKACGPLEAV